MQRDKRQQTIPSMRPTLVTLTLVVFHVRDWFLLTSEEFVVKFESMAHDSYCRRSHVI